ncbi:uncharacterized protein LOC131598265 [Vicia villosa]|uniref:uncharacterized protein LOC131598265 n=1 Tax=Vicia villosa TaxID=3911 RepID=UPI00273C89C9|nr:uncharacterized protein LOC131598265 [Vicia villosa]
MLRRVRKRWELHGIRPSWIGEEIFRELLKYWESDEFAAKSENAKKMRASEKGGCLNAVGSISTAEHVRRMTKELNRPPLMTELVARTRKKKTEAFVDNRTQKAMGITTSLLGRVMTTSTDAAIPALVVPTTIVVTAPVVVATIIWGITPEVELLTATTADLSFCEPSPSP